MRRQQTTIVRTFLVWLFLTVCGTECEQFTKCRVKLELSMCTAPQPPNSTVQRPCNTDPVCTNPLNILHVSTHIYGPHMVTQLLRTCCGNCMSEPNVTKIEKVTDVTDEMMENVDFVFPVLAKRGDTEMFGYNFIPLIESPRVYFISHPSHSVLQEIIMSCLDLWPLLLVTALMVMISGFLCWLMETWGNWEQFPRGFMVGWFEGVWWSFISMTTVSRSVIIFLITQFLILSEYIDNLVRKTVGYPSLSGRRCYNRISTSIR